MAVERHTAPAHREQRVGALPAADVRLPAARPKPIPLSRRIDTPARGRRRKPTQAHLLNEVLFRSVLIREKKRADRRERPFALLLVGIAEWSKAPTSLVSQHIAEALSAAARQTDVLGWFDDGVIGLILSNIETGTATVGPELEYRVRHELAKRVDGDTMSQLTIQIYLHTPSTREGGHELPRLESLLDTAPAATRMTTYDAVKRTGDIAISFALLCLLSPILLIVAALVKMTSQGPVVFRQVRVGQAMKPFTMLKFRTMRVNADSAIHHKFVTDFIKANSKTTGEGGLFKITNDPRLTPVGGFLRKTSLDELPQLWNVLVGEMSLVGPRPALPYEVEQYKPWHRRRILEAKPGITGLWQVMGRSRTTFDEMVRLDLRYARSRSLWTDLRILLSTPTAVIAGKGAC